MLRSVLQCHRLPRSFRFRSFATATSFSPERIRNIAIIAHVDHGKTTLVDQLLRQSGTLTSELPSSASPGDVLATRVMDSNDLERERGITILSKCTSINFQGNLINIVDTPGHADFGGEVERIMSMVDGVALIVDATEGPMTQTRFVLSKALSRGLRPLVVVNKVDRQTSRVPQVESDLFDLFATLGATDEQAEYPLLYASAKQGWASTTMTPSSTSMGPLFDLILSHVPAPTHLPTTDPFSMLSVQLEHDPYLGLLHLGRIHSGTLAVNDTIWAIDSEGKKIGEGKVKKILIRKGLEREERDVAGAGEIVSIAGIKGLSEDVVVGVNATLIRPDGWDEKGLQPLPTTPIDPPTISIMIHPNDSPFSGKEGTKLTSQLIRQRLLKESQTNIALKVLPGPTAESLEIRGRGVLHLGVLLETLRREGFELCVGAPKAVFIRDEENPGQWLEPVEECNIIVKEQYAGTVVEKLTLRKGTLVSYDPSSDDFVKITVHIPSRGLLSYLAGEFKTDVHGQGTLNHIFKGYEPVKQGLIANTGRGDKGSLVSMVNGVSSGYAMAPLQARGVMFIEPNTQVYPGMIIGECNKPQTLHVNPCLKKQLTNFRTVMADDKLVLGSPRFMGLEEMLSYMSEEEMVEITPKSIRLRKTDLEGKGRRRG
ncbi:hypothetical protein AGABI1DRAFT_62123 [Agaricus bisporus var. burnettii JB137-S8]|uniref:Tr-type G domain-containing protein n=2 Tax=Agaricus bisporus TaxID=5341 RepID=K5WP88_AGABU|nr:uncharacterized protein AGABI1DRAFT_62123 [Agaricus bisporus var. burnettii JB137-S8]EKM77116.1 hypothetical protein AGABI1DRAFT_62123 [Agaricus bisporus var. burnettii JB137-S8]